MKQILQSLKTGSTEVAEVPSPAVKRGQVLIRTSRTLVSAGTERMLVDFGWLLSTANRIWPRRLLRWVLPRHGLFMLIEARK